MGSFTRFYFIDHCDSKFKESLISVITDIGFIAVTTNMDLKTSFIVNVLKVGNLKTLMDEVPNNSLAMDTTFLAMGTLIILGNKVLEVINTSVTTIIIIKVEDNNEIMENHFENIKAILRILNGKNYMLMIVIVSLIRGRSIV